jgi:hypothetical protein
MSPLKTANRKSKISKAGRPRSFAAAQDDSMGGPNFVWDSRFQIQEVARRGYRKCRAGGTGRVQDLKFEIAYLKENGEGRVRDLRFEMADLKGKGNGTRLESQIRDGRFEMAKGRSKSAEQWVNHHSPIAKSPNGPMARCPDPPLLPQLAYNGGVC